MLVLVVDDEKSLCHLIAEIVQEHSKVLTAYNGKEALQLIRQHRPDLVVSDIMMPEMTGVELLRIIRSERATRHIPVILLSAASSQHIAAEADAFIRKPFDLDVLESTILNFINPTQSKNSNQDWPESQAAYDYSDDSISA